MSFINQLLHSYTHCYIWILTRRKRDVVSITEAHGAVGQPQSSLSQEVELCIETELRGNRIADLLEPDLQVKGHGVTRVTLDGQRVLLVHGSGTGNQFDLVGTGVIAYLWEKINVLDKCDSIFH